MPDAVTLVPGAEPTPSAVRQVGLAETRLPRGVVRACPPCVSFLLRTSTAAIDGRILPFPADSDSLL